MLELHYWVIVKSLPSTGIYLRLLAEFIQEMAEFNTAVVTSENGNRHILLQFLIKKEYPFITLP